MGSKSHLIIAGLLFLACNFPSYGCAEPEIYSEEQNGTVNVTKTVEVSVVTDLYDNNWLLSTALNQTFDAFSFLFGFRIVEAAVQLVKTTNELKRISIDFSLELRQILLQNGNNYTRQIKQILENGIIQAQQILSPLVVTIRSILGVFPDAQSITGIANVISLIENLVERLEKQIFKANVHLLELLKEILMSLQQITLEGGTRIVSQIESLLHNSIEEVKLACIPLVEVFLTPTESTFTANTFRRLMRSVANFY